MNKKMMALAVAGAFAAPAAAFAQASNVQIYGTAYIEYAYARQGTGLNNIDQLQTPGSSIGFKGEEALGGGLTGWFQCESSMDLRGGGDQAAFTANTTATAGAVNAQNSGIFCGRNSAVGFKGSWGNLFVGNWDTPWKQYNPQIMGTNETGALGTSFLLYGSSASASDGSTTVFERRQNNSISYMSPNFSGFSGGLLVSVPAPSVTTLSPTATVGKPRVFSAGLSYNNGPLIIAGAWEQHQNFSALNNANNGAATTITTGGAQKGTTDTGWMVGAAYQFGPVKVGGVYSKRNFEGGCNSATPVPGGSVCSLNDASVSSYGINGDWVIVGPHELKGAYVHANSTTGGYAQAAPVSLLTFNAGAGQTSASLWEVEYLYNFSKRTRVSLGYVSISNDAGARYNLGGFAQPTTGNSSVNAFVTTIKSTF